MIPIWKDPVGNELIGVQEVADLLKCSTRQVYRLLEKNKLPAPIRLAGLVRWNLAEIHSWIAGGCKPVNNGEDV